MKVLKKYRLIILLVLLQYMMGAQTPITLSEAVKISRNNNPKLRTEAKMIQYRQALVNTAYTYEPTQVSTQLGQFNSTYFDTGFGISQSFTLPKVFKKRVEANLQQVKTAEAYLKMSETEIRQQLDFLFLEYSYLISNEKLLKYQDSLYNGFVQKSTIRWQNGETDVLEKTTAEQQQLNIANQLAMVEKMKDYLLVNLEYLINDGQKYTPLVGEIEILDYVVYFDSLTTLKHPAIKVAEQEIEVAKAMTQVEKTALSPVINVGVNNVSIRGTGADNEVYNGFNRFTNLQIGVGIPLFRKGIRASIESAQKMEDVKNNELLVKKAEIYSKIKQQYILYTETSNQFQQYEQKALPNAKTIRSVSQNQFSNGQINYLEYVMLTNQAIDIESKYLELMRNLNNTIIDLHYLTTNY